MGLEVVADVLDGLDRIVLARDHQDVIDLGCVQRVLDAVDVGERVVHLDDDRLRSRRDRTVPQVRGAEVEVPVGVHGPRFHDQHLRRLRGGQQHERNVESPTHGDGRVAAAAEVGE